MSHHRIEVRDLRYTYPGSREAVRGMSFLIGHGESVGVIGANGAGKSTLLLLLTGLLFPDSGEVRIGDMPLTKRTLDAVRKHLGMVFQNPDDQLFTASVFDDVAFGPRNMGLAEDEVARRVSEALETVGAAHLSARAPHRLSGGEKRAAAIASVLAMQPDALIMDEPTAALDPRARRRIIGLMNGFSHTKIITSHDLDMIWETCSRVLVVRDGAIEADGPAQALLSDRALLERCGLELPLTLQGCPKCAHESRL